ncbi:solute carrier family 24 (sodium/potassium/calcium exchanger), member 4, isoform CRA_a [Mus musculus]|nr:solute carrier family 24 (sodium/potassium/calcium exchanger), member 4, isoform CRA_a [Mus musculus]
MALRGLIRQSKVRRRREMLPQQVGFVCAVLALVCCASGLFGSLGHKTASAGKHVLLDTWRNRKLMAPINGTPLAKNCTDPAIHEFPTDLFSNKERQHGAVLLHILGVSVRQGQKPLTFWHGDPICIALYMFYALAIVCDDFFVPSLEKICEKLHLSEDVAGATFMAAGSSTPELFASVIGVFITHGDVGVGTIVGSAVFNILCIIGVCGLFAGQVVRLTWWAVCRDSVYYTLSVIVLIAFIYDEEIVWYNMKMQTFFTTKQKSIANGNPVSNELEDGNDLYDGSYDDPSVPLLGQEAKGDKAKWVFTWPLIFLLCVTIPNCSKPRWEKFFMVTFITATLWIAVFSYLMVWLVTIIGYTLGIPDVIMGITFLAAGTSVPDCMASLIVARQGLGDMAVSNTIGSNVFDILVGLGIPWGLQTMVINYGSTVKINSRGLVYSVVLLLGSVALTVLGIHLNKWRLDRKLGIYVLVLYAVFLCFSIMIEFNVFTFVNLPMCREDD